MKKSGKPMAATLRTHTNRLIRLAAVGAAAGFVFMQSLWLNLGISAFPTTESADPEYCRGINSGNDTSDGHSQDCSLCPVCQTFRLGAAAPALPVATLRLHRPAWRLLLRAANDDIAEADQLDWQAPQARGPPLALERDGAVPNRRHPDLRHPLGHAA